MKHDYSGECEKCEQIMLTFPGFYDKLWVWFKCLQQKHPEAHISCCGRGKEEQEKCFNAGTSRAHFGESAHNYNAALDIFRLFEGKTDYNKIWFRDVVGGAVIKHNSDHNRDFDIEWYGMPGAKFKELPHCEVYHWQILNLSLVEKE